VDIAALITGVVTALGGFCLLGAWVQRGGIRQQQSGTSRLLAPAAATAHGAEGAVPAERHFPLPTVPAHGLFAVITLGLVLLTALSVEGG
jgi:hypothetical protein